MPPRSKSLATAAQRRSLLRQYKAARAPSTAPSPSPSPSPQTDMQASRPQPTKSPIIQATSGEIRKVLEDKAALTAGTLCPGGVRTINLYSITTRDGEKVYVYSLSREDARQRAIDTGYKVAWVGSIPSGKIPKDIAQKTAGLTRDQQWVKDYLVKEGAWKDDYISGQGFDLVRMLDDSLVGGDEFTPNDLRKIFGAETIDEAFDKLPIYRGFESHKDSSGNYDLIGILEDKNINKDMIGQVFGNDTLKWAEQADQVMAKLKPYKTDDGYNLTKALHDKAITLNEADLIFDESTINQARAWLTLSEKASKPSELGGPVSTVSGTRTATEAEMAALKNATPWKDVGFIAADALVPFFYVARNWNTISAEEKALWITLDVAFFIAPLARAAVSGARGAYAASKAAKFAIATSKSARLAGAAKGVGRELTAMVRGPVETLMHPVATTKQGVKDIRALLENALGRKKIPESVLTTTEGTLRLKVTGATSLDDYLAARDKLMRLAAKGETPLVQLKGPKGKVIAELELTSAPLMREAKGVVHTTPWGEQFKEGLTVRLKPGLPRAEQGIFVAHEPLPRFAKQSAFNMPVEIRPGGATKQVITTRFGGGQVANIHLGAELSSDTLESLAKSKLIELKGQRIQPLSNRQINKFLTTLQDSGNAKAAAAFQQTVDSYKPMFRIISPDKADNIISSGKLYRGSAEIEARIPVGARIEPPKQILYTRIGPESTRVEIWLDKPLSARQIIKLKAEGMAEVFRQPFRTPLKIKAVKGAGLAKSQVSELVKIIDAAGDARAARSLLRASSLSHNPARLMQLAMRAIRAAPKTAVSARVPGKAAATTRTRAERVEPTARARRQVMAERAEEAEAIRAREKEEREERLGRGERKVERVEHPERMKAARKADVRDWPVRTERAERIARTERATRPERPARPIRPERPVRPTRPKLEKWPTELKKERLPSEKPGLVTWKQGMYYITVVEPYRTTDGKPDVIYSRHKPPWGVKAKGRHSPRRSLKSIGKVPKLVKLPMGATTARVKHGRVLGFRRRG